MKKYSPAIYTVSFEAVNGIITFDLLTVDGGVPDETVYFMRTGDAPSFNDSSKIVEAIESEKWTLSYDVDVKDFAIELSIFETSGEAYKEVLEGLKKDLSK